ncbi:MAG: SAM hydrolase/SAM-dependent halogenase family protein [Thermomicrobiales bacterium]
MHAGGIVTLTTDFGLRDSYVAQMKGMILRTALRVTIVDVTHAISRHSIVQAAFVIADLWRMYPDGTAHVVVVDPGVGTDRRPIALEVDGQYFVGPDNGLFSHVLAAAEREGLSWRGVVLTNPDYWRVRDISATFHGRDIFAPAAAHLVNGTHLPHLGDPLDHPVRLALPSYEEAGGTIRGEIIYVDSFGNCVTNIPARILPPRAPGVTVACGPLAALPLASTYGMVGEGEPLALIGSHGYLEIAVRLGNAASDIGLDTGTPVVVSGSAA